MKNSLILIAALSVACTSNKGDTAGDSGSTDTNDTNVTGDAVYGCDVADWSICYDHYTTDGWDQASATASCDMLASQYGVSTSVLADPGCSTDDTVGDCELPSGGDFDYAVDAWYYSGGWDATTAEASCSSAGGTFYE
jgi:hypothetical protein